MKYKSNWFLTAATIIVGLIANVVVYIFYFTFVLSSHKHITTEEVPEEITKFDLLCNDDDGRIIMIPEELVLGKYVNNGLIYYMTDHHDGTNFHMKDLCVELDPTAKNNLGELVGNSIFDLRNNNGQ